MFNISNQDRQWVEAVWEKIAFKMDTVIKKTGDKIPYTTVNGVYDDKFSEDPTWWTNGLRRIVCKRVQNRPDRQFFGISKDGNRWFCFTGSEIWNLVVGIR